ncbi:MAG: GNAT family N-acetyltransferase [Defluviitaleaceae bacterium]|nr:GNAT family N-acetyltransferase [Defluviitaleaceae bacterium]
MDVTIREVDVNVDIQGIRETHGSDDHWGSNEACLASTVTSLYNGFFIQVAELDGKIVGHTEWVITDDTAQRFLYLGMMQVHEDYQKMGIGRKLVDAGIAYAKDNNCAFIRTMPNLESGSIDFYRKNGFIQTKDSNSTLKIATTVISNNNVCIDKVPSSVVKNLPLVSGLWQHSSAHMWKVFNARHEFDGRTVASYKIGNAYVNIGAYMPAEAASVACWGELTQGLISEILAVGDNLGYKYLNFCVLNENVPCFAGFKYEMLDEHDVFMELRL